jgi:hypothetical protein
MISHRALRMLHLEFYRSAIPRYLDSASGETSDSIANKNGRSTRCGTMLRQSRRSGLVIISVYP